MMEVPDNCQKNRLCRRFFGGELIMLVSIFGVVRVEGCLGTVVTNAWV